ncbi:MAG TPA: ABC transporter permease, partial [Burkholderiaceae bacterium]|nr:ABC transporter permease [Burkholderiaceae bacterium]
MNALARLWDSDVAYSFRQSPVAIGATLVAFTLIFAAIFARWVAPYNPFDLATINLMDASLPPSWEEGGNPKFWLGTDDQGRDIFSAVIYGMQISLLIGLASVALSVVMGVGLGLLSGYVGGRLDAFIMRVCDVMLSFPAILVALLIDGVARAILPRDSHNELAFGVLILAIALSGWVQYARTVRGSTLVEKNKEYIQAARVIGVSPFKIMLKHVLPNVLGPVLVLATVHIATAI